MDAIRWLQRTTEYLVGMALVMAHLALAGRGMALGEALREPRKHGLSD
jgi:hypothetical protein